jgi:hypothetical protein
MKHSIFFLTLFAALAATSALATPGSVQPVPEQGQEQEPEQEQKQEDAPKQGPESPQVPEEQPELPKQEEEITPPQRPQRPQRPQLPPQTPQRPQRPLPPGKPENPDYQVPSQPGRPQRPQRPGRQNQSHSEVVQVRQQFLGQARLPLYMLTNNLAQLQGYRLVGLTIFGYSQYGQGGAFFCSSACSQIQPVGGYPGAYRVETLAEPINPYAAQWFLELRGNFAIETIQLEFVR